MAKQAARSKSKPKSKTQAQTRLFAHGRPQMSAFVAAFAGIVAAVPLTVAAMLPLMNSEITNAVASAGSKTLNAHTAADNLSCAQPAVSAGSGGGGQVLGASTANNAGSGGNQGGGGQQPSVFIQKLIGGSLTSSGGITGPTGPGSYNAVNTTQTETVTVTNNNNLSVNNSNSQSASSGNAITARNTTAGSASSGSVSNDNSTDVNYSVNN